MPLTKAELTANIAAMTGYSKAVVGFVLDQLAREVQEQIAAGEVVTVPGIVKLTPKAKPARVGRNPATGAEVQIPAKVVVTAKVAKVIADAAVRA